MNVTLQGVPDEWSMADIATKIYREFGSKIRIRCAEQEQDEKPLHVQAAEILGHLHNTDYGLAELKIEIMRDQLRKGDWTLDGGGKTDESGADDGYEAAIIWRIKNIVEVSERDGENPFANGQVGGFKYALAIYQDCKKRGVL